MRTLIPISKRILIENLVRIDIVASTGSAAAVERRQQPSVSAGRRQNGPFSGERRTPVLCLVLLLATLAFYNPVVRNGFVNFDDTVYITTNTHVRDGLTWQTVQWAFTTLDCANWHPLTWISHALDYQIFKTNPSGHHYVNVLLHAGNAILLFLLLQSATGLAWPSVVVAALFALHPMNVESVAWASERKSVLSMLFFLLTLHAYGWYVKRVSLRRYAAVAGLFALGLMAKPAVITLPFVLLLWDYWPLQRLGGESVAASGSNGAHGERQRSLRFLLLEKAPLLLMSAASAVITVIAQRGGQALRDAPAWVRLGNAAVSYIRYIGKAFWPADLAIPYPHPGRLLPVWQIVAATTALLVVTAFIVREAMQERPRRYLVVGGFWFLGTLVPMIGLVQVSTQAMADRYAYLSFLGLFVAVVWGVAEAAEAWRIPAPWLAVPVFLILFALGMVSRHQVGYWHDSETLWRHSLSVTQRNYAAHYGLGIALEEAGRVDEAIAQLKAVEDLNAFPPAAMIALGAYEQANGRVNESVVQYQKALDNLGTGAAEARTRADALTRLGSAYLQVGDFARAKLAYGYALLEAPNSGTALLGSGLLAERDGDYASAVQQITHTVQVEPSDSNYLLLAQALRRAGRADEAEQAQEQAMRISSHPEEARKTAAQVLASAGLSSEGLPQ